MTPDIVDWADVAAIAAIARLNIEDGNVLEPGDLKSAVAGHSVNTFLGFSHTCVAVGIRYQAELEQAALDKRVERARAQIRESLEREFDVLLMTSLPKRNGVLLRNQKCSTCRYLFVHELDEPCKSCLAVSPTELSGWKAKD